MIISVPLVGVEGETFDFGGMGVHWSVHSSRELKNCIKSGTSLAVQWLRLHASNAGDMGFIPG